MEEEDLGQRELYLNIRFGAKIPDEEIRFRYLV